LCNTPYREALAAFRRDCNETERITELLRGQFRDELVPPLLDVGAGSGEVAFRAFPQLKAFLLDREAGDLPVSTNHERRVGDFAKADFGDMKPKTLIFSHSAYYFANDASAFGKTLARSGAERALVVSNEKDGLLKDAADFVQSLGVSFSNPFHTPLPGATLLRKLPFTGELDCKDFHVMAKHIVRTMLDLENCPLVSKVEDWLQSRMKDPKADIVEAIYCYRLRGTGNLDH
jgi:hypothetical protein